MIGTQGPDGADVSPRGDPAGFVRILDDRHLLLPDRIGNNRFDSYANVFTNPQVGLMFLVPGMARSCASTVWPASPMMQPSSLRQPCKAGHQRSGS